MTRGSLTDQDTVYSMKSETEEFCKSKFDAFLIKLFASSKVVWQDVAQKDEPPDYYLYLDKSKFAVEVTTLMEKVEVGTATLPEVAIIDSLWRFVDEVELIARNKRCLQGTYIVSFSQPIDDFGIVRDRIQDDLLDYIQATRFFRIIDAEAVFKQGRQQCAIQKLHNESDKITKAGPARSKWEGEAATDICHLLEERLTDKNYKLRNIVYPRILLLYDSYRFAASQMYKDCIPQLSSLASFHTVFVVQGDERSFVLYSQDSGWLD